MVWAKDRTYAENHGLADTLRGGTCLLTPDNTGAEACDATYITSLDSDGFTVGSNNWINRDTQSHVAWNWKAGGAPTADNSAGAGATPTAGSVKIDGANLGSALAGTIAATRLSANTTAGFSMVKYVGTGATATIAHGLGITPELIIVKSLDSAEAWNVYAEPVSSDPATDYLTLNTTAAVADDDRFWNDGVPAFSSTTFTVGSYDGTNKSTDDLIAYCFHSVEGYSKIGSGTLDAGIAVGGDGTFLYTGFRPAYFMFKAYSTTMSWSIFDSKRNPYNVAGEYVTANTAATEVDGDGWDFVSNGVKQREGFAGDFIWIAFAEAPFKYSNAR